MYHTPTRRRGCLVIATLGLPIFILTIYLTHRQPTPSSYTHFPVKPSRLNWPSPLRLLKSNPSSDAELIQVNHSEDGHLYFDDKVHRSTNGTSQPVLHPIVSLINNATRAWTLKLESQSKHFSTAVSEYRRRNHRNPPKGYDRWWAWASDNNVKLLDEYDYLHKSIKPFFALPPEVFRQRASALVSGQTKWSIMIFVVSIRNGQLSLSGQQANIGLRPNEMIELLKGIAHLLPDMDIPISAEDLPAVSVSARNYEHHIQAVRNSTLSGPQEMEVIEDQPGLYGWSNTCSSQSELRRHLDGLQDLSRSSNPHLGQSYIHDPVAASNFCDHPDLVQLNGFLSATQPKVHPFFPLFSFTKLNGFAELPLSPPSQFRQEVGNDPPWEEKKNKLFWRGSTTGTYFSRINNWRRSQRTRLVMFSNEPRGNVSVRTTDSKDHLEYFEADTRVLNERYFDIGFTNSPVQCDNSDQSCEAVRNAYVFKPYAEPSTTNTFKYLLDVDGNGWSGRFHRLMSTKSAILKSTIFPEWYADRIQPWHHYIPVKVDYQDLYDIMGFFLGDSNGLNAHDQIGKQIGQQGHEWTEEFWRLTDMQAYMYLLLLEYSRLLNRDPENLHSMDYF
ncbi:hypothetical protein PTTG_08354 [Puccinia triticina 1-1 BBBD Race 1]|uniref:CAP10 domain-containing protein n=2 Tax=Puccinia triticina TaxID=208348 RepID=A0A180GBR1_PUCT1|nr:uncharacterized protein PtA15_4A386 [Puccinia triticina]OAV90176.1 hypothetical protein PTTG_08354 [Puccinia triticina 1-1 BBBD Race 1]WAQ83936.1 hypothetical protein PtA15_4A386 [Puccinia triticina]